MSLLHKLKIGIVSLAAVSLIAACGGGSGSSASGAKVV